MSWKREQRTAFGNENWLSKNVFKGKNSKFNQNNLKGKIKEWMKWGSILKEFREVETQNV